MKSFPLQVGLLLPPVMAAALGFALGSWRHDRPPASEQTLPDSHRTVVSAERSESSVAREADAPSAPLAGSDQSGDAKRPRERLKELTRSGITLGMVAEVQALIGQLTAEDFRVLVSVPKEFPFVGSSMPETDSLVGRAYNEALVRRWLEANPDGAADAIRALDQALVTKVNGKTTVSGSAWGLLDALDRVRPKSVAARAEEIASGTIDWRRRGMDAVTQAFEDLARIDPSRAEELLAKISDSTTRMLANMGVNRASALASQASDPVERARASRSSETSKRAYADAARMGPEKLREALEASKSTYIDVRAVVAEGIMRDPDGAWETIPGTLAGKPGGSFAAGSKTAVQLLARELSPEDRQRSLTKADQLPAEWRTAALEPLVGAWALDEPSAAMQWVAQNRARGGAALSAFGPWLLHDAEAAIGWVQGPAPRETRQALGMQLAEIYEEDEKERQKPLGFPGSRTKIEARATAASLLEHSPAVIAHLLADLPPSQATGSALQPVLAKWLDADPAGAARWLESLPGNRRRDEAVAAFVAAAAPRDVESARAWAATISDPELQQKAAESLSRVP